MNRCALIAALVLGGALGVAPAVAQSPDFPQVKINHVDLSEAPRVYVYFSLLSSTLKSAAEDHLRDVTMMRKPESGADIELFTLAEGEVAWPRWMTDDQKSKKADEPLPELLPQVDAGRSASVVVVTPGFQDDEYRIGTLGERSRNGAGLFFRKLSKDTRMNVLWYTDDVFTYVYTEGRTTRLTSLGNQLEACRRWEREKAERFGLEEEPPEGEGPRQGQAECGLHALHEEVPSAIRRQSYAGFWPQLFGLEVQICAAVREGEMPMWAQRGLRDGELPTVNPNKVNAMDAALRMLIDGGKPHEPKILILTGDGRDGYINRYEDCRVDFRNKCSERPEVASLRGRDQQRQLEDCIEQELGRLRSADQQQFARRLEQWIALAKAANIRIYSVIHPTGSSYQHDRLAVLAWRTGGTVRYANDAEEVITYYEDLITELNSQFVVSFVDEEAKPDVTMQYGLQARVGSSRYTARPYKATVPSRVEKPLLSNVKEFGEGKLGKAGFLALVIGVGVILLLVLFKIFSKILKKGGAAAKKGAKGAKGGDKAKEKAKKEAMKKAQAKAKAKAKAKKG